MPTKKLHETRHCGYKSYGEKMGFINSYKQLEKLCNEIYRDNHGVSRYIDEMKNKPRGSYLVRGWDDDLKRLKHYRWVRNQIVHEPNCTEENMREIGDVEWIAAFYSCIMNQTDPLALYRKATAPGPVAKQGQNDWSAQSGYTYHVQHCQPKKESKKAIGGIAFAITAVLIGLVCALCFFFI